MSKVFIGYQGKLAVRVETSREVIENDLFLKCDRIEEYEGQAQLLDGKILFGEEIQTYLIDKAYKDFDSKVEQRLNAFAATRRYNSIYTAANYRDNPVQKYAEEGAYCFRMLGETYAKCEELLASYMPDVLAGKRPTPTWEEIEAQLPILEWPDERVEEPTVATEEITEQEHTYIPNEVTDASN